MSGTTTLVLGLNCTLQIMFEGRDPNHNAFCTNDEQEDPEVGLSDGLMELGFETEAIKTERSNEDPSRSLTSYRLLLEPNEVAMVVRALRQYNAHLAVLESQGNTPPHKHNEPWALSESIEMHTGLIVPKQMAYFS